MVGHQHGRAPFLVPATAQRRQGRGGFQHPLRRHPSKQAHHLGRDGFPLGFEPAGAGPHLLGAGIAIVRRPALDDIHDVHRAAIQPQRGQHPIQQLPRATDERLALRVLVAARRLADEQDVRMRIADAEHHLVPGARQLAGGAVRGLPGQFIQINGR